MESERFLKSIGERVTTIDSLAVGSIVGAPHAKYEVRLYCVERVVTHPTPPHLIPPVPRVDFHHPHVGMSIINGVVDRHHLYAPAGGEPCQGGWMPTPAAADIEGWGFESVESLCFPAYRILDDTYLRLGALIPEVALPWGAFLVQTKTGVDSVHQFVTQVKDDLRQLRCIDARLKLAAHQHSS